MAKQLIQTIINESIEIHKTDNLILKHNQKKSALKKKPKTLNLLMLEQFTLLIAIKTSKTCETSF